VNDEKKPVAPEKPKPIKVLRPPGRNRPCACGSKKKWKTCCGRTPDGVRSPQPVSTPESRLAALRQLLRNALEAALDVAHKTIGLEIDKAAIGMLSKETGKQEVAWTREPEPESKIVVLKPKLILPS
jgi:hypothetical protein